jgi:hypothetical protein
VINLRNELLVAAFEGEAETDQAGALRDVDETSGADDATAQPADVHIAVLINLAGTHEGGIQAPTVVEVELVRVRNDRRRMRGDAEVDAARRDSTIHTGLNRQRDRVR